MGGSGGVAPTNVPGCTFWVRADRGLTLLNGTTVFTWADQSGNGNNVTQSNGALEPTLFPSGGPNNQPYISFSSAATQNLLSGNAVVGANNWTVFTVHNVADTAASRPVLQVGGTGNGFGIQADTSKRDIVAYGNAAQYNGVVPLNTWEQWTAQNTSTGPVTSLRVNGVPQPLTPNNAVIGAPGARTAVGTGNGAFFNGGIAEIIAYNRVLSATEINEVESYLLNRYGFQLPVPLLVPGCALWCRSDQGITIGTGVSQWNDYSGNGNNLTSTVAGAQPTYTTSDAAYGGKPTLGFDGASKYMFRAALATPLNQPCTVIIVGQSTQVGTQFFTDGFDGTNSIRVEALAGPTLGLRATGSVVSGTANVLFPSIIGAVVNGVSSALYVNNPTAPVSVATGNPGSAGLVGITLGAAFTDSADFLNGKVAEVIVYNRALSVGELSLIYAYAAARYGISLPTPVSIPSCNLWLRGDQGVTISTGVSSWADYSGVGNNVTQATGANQPTSHTSGGPNNQAYVAFSAAASQSLSLSAAALAASPWTVFAVAQSSTPGAEGFFFSVGGATNGMAFGGSGAGTARALWYPGAAVLGDSALSPTWEQWTAQNTGAVSTLAINGTAQALTNSTTQPVAVATLTTGVGTGIGGNFWNGGIAEVIAYNRALSSQEIAQVQAYLNARYAPANTPLALGNTALWLRSDQGISLSTGVSQWNDFSGLGNNATQSTGAKQPTLNPMDAAYGFKPSLQFVSTNSQWMQLASVMTAHPATVYIVGQSTSGPSQQQFFGDSGVNRAIYLALGSSVSWTLYSGTSLPSGNTTQGVAMAFAGVYNGASSSFYINSSSAPINGNPGTNDPSSTQAIGSGNGGTANYLNGKIAEIVVFVGTHTQAQVAAMFAYFAARYSQVWS
jgi:hypothetical protein